MHTTSPSLLERVRTSSDRQAWARLVDLYTPLLFYWCRSFGLQEHDAADRVQEVFVLLLEKLPEFRYDPNRSFRSWLRTVLFNKIHEHGRKQHPLADGTVVEPVVPPESDRVSDQEFQQMLLFRAAQLIRTEFEDVTWRAFDGYVLHDRPPGDVAAELGVSVNAVYVAKSRVLRRLRDEFAGLID